MMSVRLLSPFRRLYSRAGAQSSAAATVASARPSGRCVYRPEGAGSRHDQQCPSNPMESASTPIRQWAQRDRGARGEDADRAERDRVDLVLGAHVQTVDGQRIQRCATEADDGETDDAGQQTRGKAHHQRAEAHRDEADRDGGVAEDSHDRRHDDTTGEHHHAEDAGQGRGQASRGVADLFQVGRRPHADGELAEHGIDDVQPRHEDVAIAEVGEGKVALCRVDSGTGTGQATAVSVRRRSRAVRMRYGGRHDQCNANAAPTKQAEADAGETGCAVDRGKRRGAMLAVMVADDGRHDHHEQCATHPRQRRAGERDRPCRTEAEHRDPRGDRHAADTSSDCAATEPVDDA